MANWRHTQSLDRIVAVRNVVRFPTLMLIECILLSASLCRATHDKPVMTLALSQSAALVADGITTRNRVDLGYTERDPLTRAVLGSRPTWARMAPLGVLQCLLETWLAERMRYVHA